MGDGIWPEFAAPAQAVRCAEAMVRTALTRDCSCGPDCMRRGGAARRRHRRVAVHIASRVSAMAGPGEVLVTGTVRDLVVGSGIIFDDRGRHCLKGLPDEWRVLAVERA